VKRLKEYLQDWQDWDGAAYQLAQALGMMNAEIGFLEFREEPERQFRWNPEFKGGWENMPGIKK
jgi:hypothetical protein